MGLQSSYETVYYCSYTLPNPKERLEEEYGTGRGTRFFYRSLLNYLGHITGSGVDLFSSRAVTSLGILSERKCKISTVFPGTLNPKKKEIYEGFKPFSLPLHKSANP